MVPLSLSLQGCLMATPMAFILPTASYLRLSGRGRWYHTNRLAAWAVLIIGFIVMVIGTGLAVAQVRWGRGGAEEEEEDIIIGLVATL